MWRCHRPSIRYQLIANSYYQTCNTIIKKINFNMVIHQYVRNMNHEENHISVHVVNYNKLKIIV